MRYRFEENVWVFAFNFQSKLAWKMEKQKEGGNFSYFHNIGCRWRECDDFHLDQVVQSRRSFLFSFELNRWFCASWVRNLGRTLESIDFFFRANCWFFHIFFFLLDCDRGAKKKSKFLRVYWTNSYHKGEKRWWKCKVERERKVGGRIKGSRELSSATNNNRQHWTMNSQRVYEHLRCMQICVRCERGETKVKKIFRLFEMEKIVCWIYK